MGATVCSPVRARVVASYTFNPIDLVPAAAFLLGVEFAVSTYVSNQVAEGVRLRCGEPRKVNWRDEEELEVLTTNLLQNCVPRAHLDVQMTANKGWGLFTKASIPRGTFIVE